MQQDYWIHGLSLLKNNLVATDKIISHNRAFHPVNQSVLNVGTLINYSPSYIIKVHKIGFTNIMLKAINGNTLLPKIFICRGVGRFEPTIPSDIYNYNSQDVFDANIVHGASGLPVVLTNPEYTIPCTSKTLFRLLYYYSDETWLAGFQSSGFYAKYMVMPQYQIAYENNNLNTQPITLRQNEGIFILNNVYTQANSYQDNYFEFTIE